MDDMKKLRLVLLLFTFLFATGSFAKDDSNYGLYVGAGGGYASDDGEGGEKLKGPIYNAVLGYRWIHWALEVGLTKASLKSDGGVVEKMGYLLSIDKAEVEATSIDYMLRFFLFRYFTLGVGYNSTKASHDIRVSNVNGNPGETFIFKDDVDYSGSILQAGLVLPLFSYLDLQLLYELRSWVNDDIDLGEDDDTIDPIGANLQQFSGRLVFYF